MAPTSSGDKKRRKKRRNKGVQICDPAIALINALQEQSPAKKQDLANSEEALPNSDGSSEPAE